MVIQSITLDIPSQAARSRKENPAQDIVQRSKSTLALAKRKVTKSKWKALMASHSQLKTLFYFQGSLQSKLPLKSLRKKRPLNQNLQCNHNSKTNKV
jgi:hypothetical protein